MLANKLNYGDTIIYYWYAHCMIAMPCTPAWYPEQHKLIEEWKKIKDESIFNKAWTDRY